MLRAGPGGAQRVVPKGPPHSGGGSGGPRVLSFKSITARPAATESAAPATTAAPKRIGGPPQQWAPSTVTKEEAWWPEEEEVPLAPKAKVKVAPKGQTKSTTKRSAAPGDDVDEEADDWVKQFEAKWKSALGGSSGEKEEQDEEEEEEEADEEAAAPPPVKKQRVAGGPAVSASRRASIMQEASGYDAAASAEDEKISEEHPEWAVRCTIDPARPGQPQRITVSMAELGMGDQDITEWCDWMDRRLSIGLSTVSAKKARFKASTVDFSENQLGVSGVKALCNLLEKHKVRADVLRFTGNGLGDQALRCITKYLMSSSQAVTLELHLSRNKISAEGAKWLLGCLAMHPAYPMWMSDSQRYVPLSLRLENNKTKGDAFLKAIDAACTNLYCSVSHGSDRFVDEMKHNCVVHFCAAELAKDAMLPSAGMHARSFFAPAGRGALKPLPTGVEDPPRDEPRVVFEDDDMAVVMKPAGWSCAQNPKTVDATWAKFKPMAKRKQVAELLTQGTAPALQGWLLLNWGADPTCDAVRDQSTDRGLAHRLDVDTSGPILIGKTLKGFEHARKQIVAGILKDYIVLVHGTFSTDRGECTAPVDVSPFAETKRVRTDPSGQAATTVWEAIAEYESPDREESYTLVHCRMVTLRTHQIRVHMQYLGHPIVGDKLYGPGAKPAFCPRIFIHKLRIGFFNTKGQSCVETCSLRTAPDLWQGLGKLRKTGGMASLGSGAPGL